MPAREPKPETVRLFVALDIPEHVRAGLEAWSARELTDPSLRPVAAENLHMTLVFLGRIELVQVAEVVNEVVNLPQQPVPIRFARTVTPKPARRPAIWALEAEAPAASQLQAHLSKELSISGLYEPEDRPFWAHLTVARTRTEPGKRRPRWVERPPGVLPRAVSEPFDAVRVSLYRSDLRPDGAKYVSLAKLNLPPSPESLGEER